ncbi:MAG: DUF2085 domain-containing protein [Anaerolineae bacterium]|nr:DUF2085 domain-containing protein [Anaerolineae bacterium]
MSDRINRIVAWASRHWLGIFNTIVGIYVFLPILAPMLMAAGIERPARYIYTAYSPMCHQMAFRSFFLFGEQPVYPRELAGTDFVPFEAYMSQITEFAGIDAEDWPTLFLQARQFVGNEQMGYKTALCQRDMAIFGALFFGGILYAVLRKRRTVKPLPFLWFVIIGMGPIALDGFSQLFGYYGELLPFLDFITLRESPPLTRTLTGAWFGLCVAWMVLPSIDRGVRANEAEAARRAARLQSATEATIVDAAEQDEL